MTMIAPARDGCERDAEVGGNHSAAILASGCGQGHGYTHLAAKRFGQRDDPCRRPRGGCDLRLRHFLTEYKYPPPILE